MRVMLWLQPLDAGGVYGTGVGSGGEGKNAGHE